MNWVVTKIKWIMLVSGLLTCTLFYATIAPQAALRSTFGDSLEGQLAEIIVRNWGALITLVGAMQVYGAFNPPIRRFVLIIACVSKLTFISLVLIYGKQYLGQAGIAIAIDSVMVILFIIYMISMISDRQKTANKI